MSLFFSDLAKVEQINVLIKIYKKVYSVIGSGSMHGPNSAFKREAKSYNDGKQIGLVRAADTRMAGYFMAMHRMLRLRVPLVAIVNNIQWDKWAKDGGSKKKCKFGIIKNAITNDDFWIAVYTVLRVVFPILRVLR